MDISIIPHSEVKNSLPNFLLFLNQNLDCLFIHIVPLCNLHIPIFHYFQNYFKNRCTEGCSKLITCFSSPRASRNGAAWIFNSIFHSYLKMLKEHRFLHFCSKIKYIYKMNFSVTFFWLYLIIL